MRINQNVMAANATRNLSNTNIQLGKSLEKLSSGFRINRAADDAAGLVISQGLRAQTSGLRQATRNAQDGISVVQTAEGSLNEVHTMLTRMRDLAVQSANSGANDSAARGAAQTEISALAHGNQSCVHQRPLRRRQPARRHLRRRRGHAGRRGDRTDRCRRRLGGHGGRFRVRHRRSMAAQPSPSTRPASPEHRHQMATQLTTAINAALTTAGNVHAGKVTVSAAYNTTVNQNHTGAADTAKFTISVDGLQAGEGFTTSADTTSLTVLGITAAAATNAAGAGGTFQIGANAGESCQPEHRQHLGQRPSASAVST